jgi:hypothetical protein
MPQVGFEPTIPAFERAKTVNALDCEATVIGSPYSIYYRSIIILSSPQGLCLFPSGFPTNIFYEFLSPVCPTFPTHLTVFCLVTLTIFYKVKNRYCDA